MKNKFIRIYVLLLSMMLASCLEDDKPALDPSETQNIIEFLNPGVPTSPAGSIYTAYSSSFLLSPEDHYEIRVSYSGPNKNTTDIELTLAVDPAALDIYNTHMKDGLYGKTPLAGTVLELMPVENYSIPSMTVTIPKGEKSVAFPITIFPLQFKFGHNYAVPLRIVSSSHGTLSSNFSVAILALGVRNDYDGIYEIVAGNITRYQTGPPSTDPVLGGTYGKGLKMNLATLSSNSITFPAIWKDGSVVGGLTAPQIVIDPATNLINVKATAPVTWKHIVGKVNNYDPVTRKFTINVQWGTGTGLREIRDLELKYIGPRP